jgi:hypothetical protein
MQFDKQTVIELIQQQMGSQHAARAAQQLPDQVDHEQHADLCNSSESTRRTL